MIIAAPPSLGEQGGSNAMMMKAVPPSPGKQGGSNATTTKAAPPSLGKRGWADEMTTKAIPPSLNKRGGGGRNNNEGHPPIPRQTRGGGRDNNEGCPLVMAVKDKFVYTPNNPKKMASVRFLAQLMEKKGTTYKEVQLTKEGQQWGPTHVYCITSLNVL